MRPAQRKRAAAMTGARPARGPRWRALLETRWQARVREVTELSLAYHTAAEAALAAGDVPPGGAAAQEVRALLRRTAAARRQLADVEEALGRLTAGTFGSCEQCGSAIPDVLLTAVPETRYCLRCDIEPLRVRALAGRGPR